MKRETRQFYQKAIGQVTDAGVRKLLGDLEEIERKHQVAAEAMSESIAPSVKKTEDEAQRRLFVLQIVQPGLAGLMDGSVSTLAPVFAAAFAMGRSHDAFLVGLAASIGAGISMAFAEALSDDGSMTGRGRPVLRGAVTGLMTAAGGIGHTLPFLIKDFHVAFIAAVVIVAMELATIAWVRNRYMDTPLLSAAFQVVVGGVLVFAVGVWIGSSWEGILPLKASRSISIGKSAKRLSIAVLLLLGISWWAVPVRASEEFQPVSSDELKM